MNRIYRLVWCRARGALVVASELAHVHTGGCRAVDTRKHSGLGALAMSGLTLGLFGLAGSAFAGDAKLDDLQALMAKYESSSAVSAVAAAPSSQPGAAVEASATASAAQVAAAQSAPPLNTDAALHRRIAIAKPVSGATVSAVALKIDTTVQPSTAFASPGTATAVNASTTAQFTGGDGTLRTADAALVGALDRRRTYASTALSSGLTASSVSTAAGVAMPEPVTETALSKLSLAATSGPWAALEAGSFAPISRDMSFMESDVQTATTDVDGALRTIVAAALPAVESAPAMAVADRAASPDLVAAPAASALPVVEPLPQTTQGALAQVTETVTNDPLARRLSKAAMPLSAAMEQSTLTDEPLAATVSPLPGVLGNALGDTVQGVLSTANQVSQPLVSSLTEVVSTLPVDGVKSTVNALTDTLGDGLTTTASSLGSAVTATVNPVLAALQTNLTQQSNLMQPMAIPPSSPKAPLTPEPYAGLIIGTGGFTGSANELLSSPGQSLFGGDGYIRNGNLAVNTSNITQAYTVTSILGIPVVNLTPVGTALDSLGGVTTGGNSHLTLLGGVTSGSYINNINNGSPNGVLGLLLPNEAPAWASTCANVLGIATVTCWGVNAAQDYQVLVGDGASANGSKEVVIGTNASHTLAAVDANIAFPGGGVNDSTDPTGVPTSDYDARLGHSVVVGDNASGTANAQTILGAGATSSQANSVALGYLSSANRGAQTGYVAFGLSTPQNAAGEVSIGAPGSERQITNVAAGSATTDAVNVAQLQGALSDIGAIDEFAVKYVDNGSGQPDLTRVVLGDGVIPTSLSNLAAGAIANTSTDAINGAQLYATHTTMASFFGGSTLFNPTTGLWTAPTFTITSLDANGVGTPATYGTVTDAFNAVDGSLNSVNTRINNLQNGLDDPYFEVQSVKAGASVGAEDSVAVGPEAATTGIGSVAVGYGAQATADRSQAIGVGALAAGISSLALGDSAQALTDDAVAIGNASIARNGQAVSVGAGNIADGDGAVAIGDPNNATGIGAVAVGADNTATGQGAVALGNLNTATGQGAVAIGNSSSALAAGSLAFGDTAVANNVNDVALGSGSVSAAANPTASFTVNGRTYSGLAGTAPTSVVSVGAVGGERQITNVAAGRVSITSTDAINGSQLFAVASDIGTLSGNSVQYDDAGKTVITLGGTTSTDGGLTNGTHLGNLAQGAETALSTDAINGAQLWHWSQDTTNQYSNVSLFNALSTLGSSGSLYLSVNSSLGAAQATGANAVALGPVAAAAGGNAVAIGNGASASADNSVALGAGASTSVGAQASYTGAYMAAGSSSSVGEVSVGSAGNVRQLTNVADGSDAHDAANVGQLESGVNYAINQSKSYTDQQITNINNGASGMFQVNNTSGLAAPSASGQNAVAGGAGATAAGTGSTAIGNGAQAQAANSVALGAGSVAERANSVSVGSTGGERQITHVAAGTTGTDAVNVNQLNAAQASTVRYDINSNGTTNYGSVSLGQGGTPAVVHNVAAGSADTDAVNVGQVTQALNWAKSYTDQQLGSLNRQINDVGNRANAGIASAMAAAGLPQAYEPGKSMAAVAAGSFHGESSLAVGVSMISEGGRWVYKLTGSSNTRGDAGVSMGAGIQW
jgi:autotransporter adhesin